MSSYQPDAWTVLRFNHNGVTTDKVLSGWYGGYGNGDSWRISSGITKIEDKDTYFLITNHSGSEYICHKNCERMSGLMATQFEQYSSQIEKHNEVEPDKVSMEIIKLGDKNAI